MTMGRDLEAATWDTWAGGDKPPVLGRAVDIKLRCGFVNLRVLPSEWSWAHLGKGDDIVAWRDSNPQALPTDGNHDANGEGKPTNPKDVIGAQKAKFSVIPAPVLFDVGLAMLEGAVKYGRHNYRYAGVRSSVYYDAAMGHIADWWEGQDVDPESGLSHVTKAIASLVVLRDAMFQDMLEDDRPPRSKVFKPDFNVTAAGIIARHKDKSPRHFTIADSDKGQQPTRPTSDDRKQEAQGTGTASS